MSEQFFSPSWPRVADLRPRLGSHTVVHRQVFRGDVWYVLEDPANAGFQRISQAAWRLVGLMDGRRTVDDIWRAAGEVLGDDLPTQDEVIRLLARLHAADVIHVEIPADIARVVARGEKTARRKRQASVRNPIAIRVPLFDPERFIAATFWLVRPLTGWLGLLLWLGVVAWGVTLAAVNWDALTQNVSDRAITAGNLLLLAAVYPLVKALHELGHAYAVKKWGGEVHEIGVMFLVFLPVPYVDATASYAFREKWRRAAVAAAGILVELFLAGLAMILWTHLEPGLARATCLNVMLLAGVSTLLFNGNPLLRFDGYYVLVDLAEIPNLGQRSTQHLQYLAQRWLFGMEDAQSPATARGEATWFVVYGILALVYRLFIMAAIVMVVAGQFFEVGLLLAIWTVILILVVPVSKGIWFVLASPRLEGRRARALTVTAATLAGLGWLLFVQPAPNATIVQGVVWAPERTVARAGAEGFVAELLAEPGRILAEGDPILRIEAPLLDARVVLLEARIDEIRLRRLALSATDRAAADLARQELQLIEEELAFAVALQGERVLRSPNAGRLLQPAGEELLGRYVRRGEMLAWVLGETDATVRAAVAQEDVDLVRRQSEAVAFRFASAPERVVPAKILRETPGATYDLPSPALARQAGGRIDLDPTAPANAPRSLDRLFLFDLVPAAPLALDHLGARVTIRFRHGSAPLGAQLWRGLRQVLLRDLGV